MTTRVRARVTLVTSEKRGGVLAAAASIGDGTLQVRDAGDFAADDVESGTLLVDDDTAVTLEFTSVDYVEDDDPSDLSGFDTIHLAAPLEAAIEEGTNLWVWEEPADASDDDSAGILADVTALCVPEDDEDAVDTGEQIEADVPRDFQDDLLPGRQAGRGVKVVLEWDDEVEEWFVARIRGKGSRAIQFESAEPAYTPTSDELTAGTFTRQLLHRNIAAEHGLFTTINGVALGSEWWTLDASSGQVTVTIPDWVAAAPEGYREFGWPMYAYRRGIAVDPPEVEPVIEYVDLLPHAVYRSGALQAGGADIWNDASDATSTALSGDSAGSDTPAYGWLDASAIDPAKVTDIAIVARYLAETTEGVDDFPIVVSIVHDDPGGGSSSPYMDVAAVRSVHSQPVITEDAWFLTDDDFANIGLTKAEVAEGLTRVRDLANGMRAVRFEFLSGFLTTPPATGTRSLTVYEAKVRVFYEVP